MLSNISMLENAELDVDDDSEVKIMCSHLPSSLELEECIQSVLSKSKVKTLDIKIEHCDKDLRVEMGREFLPGPYTGGEVGVVSHPPTRKQPRLVPPSLK